MNKIKCILAEVRPAVSVSLYTTLTRLQMEHHIQFWAPQLKIVVKKLEMVHRKVNKLFRSLEHMPYKKLKELKCSVWPRGS